MAKLIAKYFFSKKMAFKKRNEFSNRIFLHLWRNVSEIPIWNRTLGSNQGNVYTCPTTSGEARVLVANVLGPGSGSGSASPSGSFSGAFTAASSCV